jgi:hypothetical protein
MVPSDLARQYAAACARAEAAHRRADNEAAVVSRHEIELGTAGPLTRRLHESMIEAHRGAEQRHLAAAAIHLAFAARINLRMAEHEHASGDGAVVPSFMAAVAEVVHGRCALLTLRGHRAGLDALVTSTPLGRAAQDIELVLGEGPSLDATARGQVWVTSPSAISARWPRYGPDIVDLGVRSLIAVALPPQTDGLGTLVVLDPGDRPVSASVRRARVVGAALTEMLLADMLLGSPDPGDATLPPLPLLAQADYHERANQATGMIMAQRGCSVADALALLRARAFAEGVMIDEIADRIVAGATRIDD